MKVLPFSLMMMMMMMMMMQVSINGSAPGTDILLVKIW
jgi:hypothetical protein